MENCQSCRFFFETAERNRICRRYPATQFKGSDDWCGEFQAALESTEAVPAVRPADEPPNGEKADIVPPIEEFEASQALSEKLIRRRGRKPRWQRK